MKFFCFFLDAFIAVFRSATVVANVEQHNHWLLEKPPLERFTALDICKFTAKWFVSCSLL